MVILFLGKLMEDMEEGLSILYIKSVNLFNGVLNPNYLIGSRL